MSNKIGQSSGATPPPLYAAGGERGRSYASSSDAMTGLFNIFAESAIKGRPDEGELKQMLPTPNYDQNQGSQQEHSSVNAEPTGGRSDPSPDSLGNETVLQSNPQDNTASQSEIQQPEQVQQEAEYAQHAIDQDQQPHASQQSEQPEVRGFSEEGAQEAAREAAQEAAQEQMHIVRDFADPNMLQAQTNKNQRSNSSLLFSLTQNTAQNTNLNAPLQSDNASNPPIREEAGTESSFAGSTAKNAHLSTPHALPSSNAMATSSKLPVQIQSQGLALAANSKGSANQPLSLPPSSNTLHTLIAEGKLTSWNAVRNYFSQMAQAMVSLQSQNLPHGELTSAHFLINPQGKVLFAFPGMPTFGTGSAGLMPSIANGQKGDAFNAGLILLQMCTGKQADAINPATNKTLRQEIVEGRLQLPSHIPEDLKQVLSGLLQLHSQERIELAKVPSLLQPLSQSKPSESTLVSTPFAHVKGGEIARPVAGTIQEDPLVSSLPITTSTLFVNSSPTAKSLAPAKNSDEEEQEENTPSLQVVVFGEEIWGNAMDEEMLALIHALKDKKTRVTLLSEQEQNENSLFDLHLPARKIQLGRPYLQGYDALIKVIDVPAKEILFIDRNPERVKNARIAGMDALVFTSPRQLQDALSKRNLLDSI